MDKYQQNDISAMRTLGKDLVGRWQDILQLVSDKTGFIADRQILRQSEWWKTGKVGAIHVPGILKEQNVRGVLKIQGTKPKTSEALMIQAFAAQNKSKIIRPPKVYEFIEWDESSQFEVIILEEVKGAPVVITRPATEKESSHFFELYVEYRNKCRNTPWIERPTNLSYRTQLSIWKDSVKEESHKDRLGKHEDKDLVQRAVSIIEDIISCEELEFMHGHFQPGDLILTQGKNVVLFSNLFWSWRIPFYDAVFAYHWWILGMEHVPNLTSEILETERAKWKKRIYRLPDTFSSNAKRLLDIAFLERAVAALEVDRFMNDQNTPSSKVICDGIRTEIKQLLERLQ